MVAAQPTAREASPLMGVTMAATTIGIFTGILSLFISTDLAIRLAAAILVGVVGILSFVRHSLCYKSDQIRMGWRQDHPGFQLEVGYANLAFGIWALAAAAACRGLVCGIMLAASATYLLCALLLHFSEARAGADPDIPALRTRVIRSVLSTGFFELFLFLLAVIAFARSGLLSFLQRKPASFLTRF